MKKASTFPRAAHLTIRAIPLFLLLLIFTSSIAQNETNMWYFGKKAAIDFNSGTPVVLTNSAMTSVEGCASIANSSGSLLFYTHGDTIWNASHAPMPNGGGLWGGMNNSTQTGMIVPKPGSTSLYYVFTTPAQAGFLGGYNGLSYSIVDMTLDGGLGDVTVKNDTLLWGVTEKITAVKHCNGTDIWVIVHKFNSNAFYAYLVTSTGISPPVVSTAGAFLGAGFGNANCLGQMKASPNGKKLASVTYAFGVPSGLFDFDSSTGIVSNAVNIPMSGYGVEFSPDGTKLYYAAQQTSTTNWGVYQFDLCAPDIPASMMLISNNPYEDVQSLQLAPDDKIYVARWNSFGPNPNLAAINNPDEAGLACNYADSALYLDGKESMFGLPGFVTSHFYHAPSFTYSDTCFNDTTSFAIDCNTDVPDSVLWNFGDPSTGVLNTSAALNGTHVYSAPGAYSVTLIVYFRCRIDTVSSSLTILASPALSLSPSSPGICAGDSITITASGAATYSWFPGTNLSSTTGTPVTAFPSSTASYTLTGTSAAGCTSNLPFSVTVDSPPSPLISGTTTVCNGQSTTLTASGGSAYLWNTGASTASVTVSPSASTTYTVTVSNGGCSVTATQIVTVIAAPTASISGTSSICSGQNTTLTAAGGGTYLWNTGASTAGLTVSPAATTSYTVTVDNGVCTDTATVTVTVNPLPVAAVSGSDTICSGQSSLLTASGGSAYSWSTGDATSVITVSPSVTTSYTVTVSNGTCSDSASFNVVVHPIPAAGITGTFAICSGQSTMLTASGGGTYAWNTGASTANITVSPLTNTSYTVSVTNSFGCTSVTSQSVTVDTPPNPSLTGATMICAGDNATLTASGGSSYLWSTGSGTATLNVAPAATTTYTVTVSNGACSDTISQTVTVNPLPAASAGPDLTISSGDTATITAAGGGTYLWSNGATTATITVDPTITSTYCVTVTNTAGCTDTDCMSLNVELDCGDVFVPNVFSPNSDNANDLHCVYGKCILSMTFMIYDRWGEKVFEASDTGQCWDGLYKGKMMNTAVFVYYLEATLITGETVIKKGNITLMK